MKKPLSFEELSALRSQINQRRGWAKYFRAKGLKKEAEIQERKAAQLAKGYETVTTGDPRKMARRKKH